MSKTITVFGATGNQGGSVINSILSDSELSKTYKIRAVTRDPTKESGKKLAAKGVEVVKGDLNDAESVAAAINGADAVFAVTNYWDTMDPDIERKQGKCMVDAAIAANVNYLIWSGLPPVTKMTNGELKQVEHFDSKADVWEYILSKDIPAACFQPAMFFSNMKTMIRPGQDGGYAVYSSLNPDQKVPWIAIEKDTGVFVTAILKNPMGCKGQELIGASDWVSPKEYATYVGKKLGKPVAYTQIPDEALEAAIAKTGNPKPGELMENFKLVRVYGYYGEKGEEHYKETLKLVPSKLTTYQEYVDETWPWKV